MKIILRTALVLTIIAGILGIYRGSSMSSMVEKIKKERDEEKTQRADYARKLTALQNEHSLSARSLSESQSKNAALKASIGNLGVTQANLNKLLADTKAVLANVETKLAQSKKYVDEAVVKLAKLNKLEEEVTAYRNITLKGGAISPADIQKILKEFQAKKDAEAKANLAAETKAKTEKRNTGQVVNVDHKYGFVLIDVGEDNTSVGDIWTVRKAGGSGYVGEIEVKRVKKGFAICGIIRKMTSGFEKNNIYGDLTTGQTVYIKSRVPKKAKVLHESIQFGFFMVELGKNKVVIGKKYTVRRGTRLIGYLVPTRIQGTQAICQLDKANSPSKPAAGDDVYLSK